MKNKYSKGILCHSDCVVMLLFIAGGAVMSHRVITRSDSDEVILGSRLPA